MWYYPKMREELKEKGFDPAFVDGMSNAVLELYYRTFCL